MDNTVSILFQFENEGKALFQVECYTLANKYCGWQQFLLQGELA